MTRIKSVYGMRDDKLRVNSAETIYYIHIIEF